MQRWGPRRTGGGMLATGYRNGSSHRMLGGPEWAPGVEGATGMPRVGIEVLPRCQRRGSRDHQRSPGRGPAAPARTSGGRSVTAPSGGSPLEERLVAGGGPRRARPDGLRRLRDITTGAL